MTRTETIVVTATEEGMKFLCDVHMGRATIPGITITTFVHGNSVKQADLYEQALGKIADGVKYPDEIAEQALEKGEII